MKNEYARPHQKSVLRMHPHAHFLTTFCTQVQNIAAPARVPTLNLLLHIARPHRFSDLPQSWEFMW